MSNRENRVRELFPEVNRISDKALAQKVVDIWAECWERSSWSDKDLTAITEPKGPNTNEDDLVSHVRAVVHMSEAIAGVAVKDHASPVNMDYLIAAALLHDVGKLMERTPPYDLTQFGKLKMHASYGVAKCVEKDLPVEISHAVESHSFNSSTKPPATLEAIILHYADFADSDVLKVEAGDKTLVARKWGK